VENHLTVASLPTPIFKVTKSVTFSQSFPSGMDWEEPVKSLGIDLGIVSCGWALIETDVAQ
jgi:hypothetical protein